MSTVNVIRPTNACSHLIWTSGNGSGSAEAFFDLQATIEEWHALLLFVIFGIFAAGLAKLFSYIREKVYRDKDDVDTAFDAGGKVSIGLTATTIVSQWTWAATLLQSSAVASKYGISGPFWYASGATVQILLFAILSVELKVRAPGAKTFLQVIKARFGKRTHLVYVVFALMTNVIVTAMLMLGSAAVMTSLIKDYSVEQATMAVICVIGTYTFIGGLGATFYVSYVNTAMIFAVILVFCFKVYQDGGEYLGSPAVVYSLVNCHVGPEGNAENSYLTMLSQSGLMFGIINVVGNFGTVFVDQAYWQSSVAAKPKQGVWGFLSGAVVWFAVPFAFATTMGIAYIGLSAENGQPLLTDQQVNAGLVPVSVAQKLMGYPGEFMVLILVFMAVISTGSAEVIAVSSILVYDIYRYYLKPFRPVTEKNKCLLCDRYRPDASTAATMNGPTPEPTKSPDPPETPEFCDCEGMEFCYICQEDTRERALSKRVLKPDYRCSIHGDYRRYNDILSHTKNWCLLWTTLAIVPITLILEKLGVSLGWLYLFMGVVIGSAVCPNAFLVTWNGLTGIGMQVGAIGGCILGVSSWLIVASTYPGGLAPEHFFKNTGSELSMLIGNLVSICSGGVLTVIVSIMSNRRHRRAGEQPAEPQFYVSTEVENPLHPWTQLYAKELNLVDTHKLYIKPSYRELAASFRRTRIIAYTGASISTLLLIVVWPASMISLAVFTEAQFEHWVMLAEGWAVVAATFIIISPVVNEVREVRAAYKHSRLLDNTAAENTYHAAPPTRGDIGYSPQRSSSGTNNGTGPGGKEADTQI